MLVSENTFGRAESRIAGKQLSGFLRRLAGSPFFIKLFNWEYWPMYITNAPLIMIWLWFALRARRLFFFTAANPVIETGGAWGESKINILRRIPPEYVPATVFVKSGAGIDAVLQAMRNNSLKFPVIAKPNVGERGFLVAKITSEDELAAYLSNTPTDFLLQHFVDLPLELAVLCHRLPGEKEGQVTSICVKETLKVRGDGSSTVQKLMEDYPRANLQLPRFRATHQQLMEKIPAAGEIIELEPIGNHCRGTMFLNGNQYIDEELTAVFSKVLQQMEGIYYGRFDLKCRSIEDIRKGGGFVVMEFNGIGAEPAHIYDPAFPVWNKYRDIYRHWQIIYRISKLQTANGVKAMSLSEAVSSLRIYLKYKRQFS